MTKKETAAMLERHAERKAAARKWSTLSDSEREEIQRTVSSWHWTNCHNDDSLWGRNERNEWCRYS